MKDLQDTLEGEDTGLDSEQQHQPAEWEKERGMYVGTYTCEIR